MSNKHLLQLNDIATRTGAFTFEDDALAINWVINELAQKDKRIEKLEAENKRLRDENAAFQYNNTRLGGG